MYLCTGMVSLDHIYMILLSPKEYDSVWIDALQPDRLSH